MKKLVIYLAVIVSYSNTANSQIEKPVTKYSIGLIYYNPD